MSETKRPHLYDEAKVLIATKHNKQSVIAPVLKDALNIQSEVTTHFDTDIFGTFTGEIPRQHSQLDACLLKAKTAANQFNFAYSLANEGSFGPHPEIYFIPADVEVMTFFDKQRDIFITESIISTETNYNSLTVLHDEPYDTFLEKVHFPGHALILREKESAHIIQKGIRHKKVLASLITDYFKHHKHQSLILETDMRAMMNPMRLSVIEALAQKLVNRLKTLCPACRIPGFGIKAYQGKLACKSCGAPTEMHESIQLSCVKCDYIISNKREDGLNFADPGFCQYCNP